jgi:hypothetical protein
VALLEIKKTPDGRILARRKDRLPLTLADCEEARRLAIIEDFPPRVWVTEEIRYSGRLKAVKICSAVLEDHLWLILDRGFEPRDGLAVYYPEELPTLRTKTSEELRAIHKVKLAFPGCRVVQEGPEARGLSDE